MRQTCLTNLSHFAGHGIAGRDFSTAALRASARNDRGAPVAASHNETNVSDQFVSFPGFRAVFCERHMNQSGGSAPFTAEK